MTLLVNRNATPGPGGSRLGEEDGGRRARPQGTALRAADSQAEVPRGSAAAGFPGVTALLSTWKQAFVESC